MDGGPPEPDPRLSTAVRDLLGLKELAVAFQPVLDLASGRVFAYEALLRMPPTARYPDPPAVIEAAVERNCVGGLGRMIRQLAVDACPSHALLLNVHPSEFDEGWLVRPDDPIFRHEHPVFLEITESVPLSHFSWCDSVLREIRGKGICLAVDDLGAGYSNLRYISDLNPDLVKLDRSLVADLAADRRMQKLVSSMVRLCEELGARVVAEGIETPEEFRAIQDTGAHYGQGFHIAVPSLTLPVVDRERLGFTRGV